jgi:hypothetical protein
VHRCCSMEGSNFFAQAEHSSSKTFVCFGIREKSITGDLGYTFAPGDALRSPANNPLAV